MQSHKQTARIGGPIRGDFLIHVDVARILANREKGDHQQVTVIRSIDRMSKPIYCREVAFDGPARFVHHEFQKIEGTTVQNWVEVDMALMFRDRKPITVLRNRKEGRNDPVIAVRDVSKPRVNW